MFSRLVILEILLKLKRIRVTNTLRNFNFLYPSPQFIEKKIVSNKISGDYFRKVNTLRSLDVMVQKEL